MVRLRNCSSIPAPTLSAECLTFFFWFFCSYLLSTAGVKKASKVPLPELALTMGDEEFCYEVLNKVSRSFAMVIQQLPESLKLAVCVFYLVLRALDSIEDDMDITLKVKIPHLRSFHEKLTIDGWNVSGMGDSPDYKTLLENFHKIIPMIKSLPPAFIETIRDITHKMGDGMADFAERKTVKKTEDYNLYCHYVAGLVGLGLSRLFADSGLVPASITSKQNEILSNSMGLFLQKTNIIRDYLEDIIEGRVWWPEEIWSIYVPSLEYLKENPECPKSLACLNHMVTNSLSHVDDALKYMALLPEANIFKFCAIPQVMAIATLSKVYNNTRVFQGVVKVHKGLSCRMMLETNDMQKVRETFAFFVTDIASKIPPHDPSAAKYVFISLSLPSSISLCCSSACFLLQLFFCLAFFFFTW